MLRITVIAVALARRPRRIGRPACQAQRPRRKHSSRCGRAWVRRDDARGAILPRRSEFVWRSIEAASPRLPEGDALPRRLGLVSWLTRRVRSPERRTLTRFRSCRPPVAAAAAVEPCSRSTLPRAQRPASPSTWLGRSRPIRRTPRLSARSSRTRAGAASREDRPGAAISSVMRAGEARPCGSSGHRMARWSRQDRLQKDGAIVERSPLPAAERRDVPAGRTAAKARASTFVSSIGSKFAHRMKLEELETRRRARRSSAWCLPVPLAHESRAPQTRRCPESSLGAKPVVERYADGAARAGESRDTKSLAPWSGCGERFNRDCIEVLHDLV